MSALKLKIIFTSSKRHGLIVWSKACCSITCIISVALFTVLAAAAIGVGIYTAIINKIEPIVTSTSTMSLVNTTSKVCFNLSKDLKPISSVARNLLKGVLTRRKILDPYE